MESAVHYFCPMCGYDLHGIPEHRCPECGYGYDRTAIVILSQQHATNAVRVLYRLLPTAVAGGACVLTAMLGHLPLSGTLRAALAVCLLVGAAWYWIRCDLAPPRIFDRTLWILLLLACGLCLVVPLFTTFPPSALCAATGICTYGWLQYLSYPEVCPFFHKNLTAECRRRYHWMANLSFYGLLADSSLVGWGWLA